MLIAAFGFDFLSQIPGWFAGLELSTKICWLIVPVIAASVGLFFAIVCDGDMEEGGEHRPNARIRHYRAPKLYNPHGYEYAPSSMIARILHGCGSLTNDRSFARSGVPMALLRLYLYPLAERVFRFHERVKWFFYFYAIVSSCAILVLLVLAFLSTIVLLFKAIP